MTQIICEERLCTGCGACFQICPRSAILMKADEEGFLYPRIDETLCNDCGLCRRTCPVNRKAQDTEAADLKFMDSEEVAESSGAGNKVFACYSKEEDLRAISSSGGVFTELALSVQRENGAAFGAGLDSECTVRHSSIDNERDLDGLRRSKYVQSDTEIPSVRLGHFKGGQESPLLRDALQIAGLKAYINSEAPNLITCDLACHGVHLKGVGYVFETISVTNTAIKSKEFHSGINQPVGLTVACA